MPVVALESLIGAAHPASVGVRLWVFSLAFLFAVADKAKLRAKRQNRDEVLGRTALSGARPPATRIYLNILEEHRVPRGLRSRASSNR